MEHLVQKAVAKFGSQQKLAEACGVTQVAISKLLRADRVSAEMAIKIERATNGEVACWQMRPDLWPAPDDGEAA